MKHFLPKSESFESRVEWLKSRYVDVSRRGWALKWLRWWLECEQLHSPSATSGQCECVSLDPRMQQLKNHLNLPTYTRTAKKLHFHAMPVVPLLETRLWLLELSKVARNHCHHCHHRPDPVCPVTADTARTNTTATFIAVTTVLPLSSLYTVTAVTQPPLSHSRRCHTVTAATTKSINTFSVHTSLLIIRTHAKVGYDIDGGSEAIW